MVLCSKGTLHEIRRITAEGEALHEEASNQRTCIAEARKAIVKLKAEENLLQARVDRLRGDVQTMEARLASGRKALDSVKWNFWD